MREPTLKDLRKIVEKQLAMGKPPEQDAAIVHLLLEACDEIQALIQRVNECDRRDAFAKYGRQCRCDNG